MRYYYKTDLGMSYCGDFIETISKLKCDGQFQLILTSPPFPLNKKKKYGNMEGQEYIEWIKSLAPVFCDLLANDGSLVIEIGNAWEKDRPVQSLLPLKSLMALTEGDSGLRFIQEFICHNPARIPSPAQWVTVNRIRAIDSFTHVWWLAKTDYPKANNERILRPYSKSMERLLGRKKYNTGQRPSEHSISKTSFLKRQEGSISHNVLEMESEGKELRLPYSMQNIANTSSNDRYLTACREKGITPHPARMPLGLAAFFIEFLTDEGDYVLDPFAGSNTTGYCAEVLGRKWVATEMEEEYLYQSSFRFLGQDRKMIKTGKAFREYADTRTNRSI